MRPWVGWKQNRIIIILNGNTAVFFSKSHCIGVLKDILVFERKAFYGGFE
jgi:hypothetical protein